MKHTVLKYAAVMSLGVVLVATLAFVLVGSASAAVALPCRAKPCTSTEGPITDAGCDGGRVARRWNAIQNDWERNFCDDLYTAVPTDDPFDAVFGHNHGNYGWDYGQAIQYLLDEGFGSGQLSTYQGQVNALVSLGLWNTSTQSIPGGADLSFLYTQRPEPEPGLFVIPGLPTQ